MQPIHIFRSGSHTAMSGVSLDFTDEMLKQVAANYDPAAHEAPIVVGHPKGNHPAFGWLSGLEFREGEGLFATPDQVNADFEELVSKGSYKKVSASLYTPTSPGNPVPGEYYIRHLGFLGAQPPALKGLQDVEFQEEEEGTLEFAAEWEVASVFRRMREWMIEQFGIEAADKAIPGWAVESTEDAARSPKNEQADGSLAYYQENNEDNPMTEAELIAAKAQLEADQAKLATDQAALDTSTASFQEQQTAALAISLATRKKAIGDTVKQLVTDGKLAPAKAEAVQDFAEKLDADATVEFGEGEDKKTQGAADFFFSLITEGATSVDFTEQSASDGETLGDIESSQELADAAVEYQEAQAGKGKTISITQAVMHIQQTQDA